VRRRLSLTRAFYLGLTTGVVYFAATLYWITNVMTQYGGLPTLVSLLVNALLIGYVALFPALFAVVVRRLLLAFGAPALIAAPFVWVATELGRTHLFGGFPWVLLGYSQVTNIPIAQLASVFGVYGVSALVAGVSAAAAGCMATRGVRARLQAVGAVAVLLALTAAWGSWRASRAEWTHTGQPVTVGLIQGNATEAERRDAAQSMRIFQDQLRMTRQAIGAGAELVIWSESAMSPYRFDDTGETSGLLRRVAREAHVPILVGSDQVVRGQPDTWYNAAFLVRPDGGNGGVYRKMHLVPFGEYVPLKSLLFFIGPLVEAIGSGFAAGVDPTVLPVSGHSLSVAICYEVVYPALVRQFVIGGSELLTTITNDSWFGPTSAPYQHFAQASMRAIEEGRYLVRAANTGISGIVDPYGRVLDRSGIFEPAVVVGQARFLKTTTLYTRWGDVFAYASVGLVVVAILLARRRVQ
jgi:apolipoprotein N-acyltransferase